MNTATKIKNDKYHDHSKPKNKIFVPGGICRIRESALGHSGYSLVMEQNMPRSGDILVGYQLLNEPGTAPCGGCWDFASLKLSRRKTIYRVAASDDGILLESSGNIVHVKTDSCGVLSRHTFSAPGENLSYSIAEPLLKYPFGYGDAISGMFCATGRTDGTQWMRQAGRTTTRAIAAGRMITPDGDSLRHVLLVQSTRIGTTTVSALASDVLPVSDLEIDSCLNSDSVCHRVIALRWFARGFRYPIVERQTVYTLYYGNIVDSTCTSIYIPPRFQTEGLEEDPVNAAIRAEEADLPFGPQAKTVAYKSGRLNGYLNGLSAECNVSPTKVTSGTTVSINTPEPASVAITLYSPSGASLWRRTLQVTSGMSRIDCDTSHLPKGTGLITVSVGESLFSFKIMK